MRNSTQRYKDISGQVFGRLTALNYVGKDRHNRAIWKCRCECGNTTEVVGINLWNEYTKSCGCLFDEMNRGITIDENGDTKRIYTIWAAMKQRCLNENSKSYPYYGGRGIKICDEWMEFEPFMIWAENNGYSDDLSIERMDNDGNYEPDNCTWANKTAQVLNRKIKNESSGVNGVTWHKQSKKWYARVYIGGKIEYGKLFDDKDEAIKALKKNKKRIYNQQLES